MEALKIAPESLLKKLGDIPSIPSVVYELSRIINDPMSSTKDVEEIMSQDIGLTTKVLKLANSAYYAIPGGVSTLARAIAFIGFDTIHQLVVSASIIETLDTKGPSNFDINEFWKHSLATAITAETIAKFIKHPSPSELFTAGLVHDIGKVALFLIAPDVFLEVVDRAKKLQLSFLEVEIASGLTPHTELGKSLAEKWRLPRLFSLAALYHHDYEIETRANLSAESNQVIDIVVLSNLLVHALKFGNSGHEKINGAPTRLLQRLRIHPQSEMPSLLKNIKMQIEQGSDFIRMLGAK
jgi:HD-like signal output (HDOD) protein